MRVIRFASLTPTPWKNGGGTTTEIAVSPDGAGLENFDWRVSIAVVAGDGPFSLFPGIDRALTLIEGDGLAMAIEGRPPLTLTTASDPLPFPGDVPVSASLIGGPIRDLNVMSRRGRIRHHVARHDLRAGPAALPSGGTRLVVSLGSGPMAVGEAALTMAFGDVIEMAGENPVSLQGSHPVLIISLTASGPGLR
nr:HutD family protein [Labrys monachus]